MPRVWLVEAEGVGPGRPWAVFAIPLLLFVCMPGTRGKNKSMRLGGSVLSPEGPGNINPSTADALPETRAVCVVLGWPGAQVYHCKLLTNPFLPPGSYSNLIERPTPAHPHRVDKHIDARGGRTTDDNQPQDTAALTCGPRSSNRSSRRSAPRKTRERKRH